MSSLLILTPRSNSEAAYLGKVYAVPQTIQVPNTSQGTVPFHTLSASKSSTGDRTHSILGSALDAP